MPRDEAPPPFTVRLSEDWRIGWDGTQWILEEHVIRTSRTAGDQYEDWANPLYYGDLGSLARTLLRRSISAVGHLDLNEFLDRINQAEVAVTRAIYSASGWPEFVPGQKDEQVKHLLEERDIMIENGAIPPFTRVPKPTAQEVAEFRIKL